MILNVLIFIKVLIQIDNIDPTVKELHNGMNNSNIYIKEIYTILF